MRQVAIGLAAGVLLGSAIAASAGYIDRDRFATYTELEQLAYVAGVSDAIEAVSALHQATRDPAAVALIVARADACTDPLKLGQVLDVARGAIISHPDMPPAAAILAALAQCSTGSGPQPQLPPTQSQ